MSQRLTLAERVAHFKAAFPKHPAAWPVLVQEDGHPVLYARWLGGGDYSAATRFYGQFPRGFLPRLLALFPDIEARHVLHAFSGSLPPGAYTRLDVNPELAPDVVGNVYDAPQLLAGRRFRLIIADPPYTPADAKRYGTRGIDRGRATRALAAVAAPRGFLAWLDCTWPMHARALWRTVGRIAITRSTNHRTRDLTIFERVAPPSTSCSATSNEREKHEVAKAAPGELACAFGYPSPTVPGYAGPHHCPECAAEVERRGRAFDEAVARGEYDAQGYRLGAKGERLRQ